MEAGDFEFSLFPKLRVPSWGVPIMRIIVFWRICCDPPIFRKLQYNPMIPIWLL